MEAKIAPRLGALIAALSLCVSSCQQSVAENASATPAVPLPPKISIPKALPASQDGRYYVNNPGIQKDPILLTLDPTMQSQLDAFISDNGNPIAAVIVVDIATGNILAMSQGRAPDQWGAITHSALHTGFPAASLFKTVTSATVFENADMDPDEKIGLKGGCGDVHPRAMWLQDWNFRKGEGDMTISRAYGRSCNGFFAKMAISMVGLGAIVNMAKKFGWNHDPFPSDFEMLPLPFSPPPPEASSVHTVGEFAAGFGRVGLSAVHAGWQMMAIANDGMTKPIYLRQKRNLLSNGADPLQAFARRVISIETAKKIRHVMRSTVQTGTASFAYRRGKYRYLRDDVGGKTGTLTGDSPEGLTTWFSGLYPLEKPEIAVASVVMLEDHWRIKAPQLAAEAISLYANKKKTSENVSVSRSKRRAR